jgi:uncharacterized membrane protein
LLGVIGLLLPMTARTACTCLALLLVAMFPANAHAARQHLSIAGRPVPGLAVRTAIQIVFLSVLIAGALLK